MRMVEAMMATGVDMGGDGAIGGVDLGVAHVETRTWYVLTCRAGCETRPGVAVAGAKERIEEAGGRVYVPMATVWQRAGRGPVKNRARVKVRLPVFAGYLFVREPDLRLWTIMRQLDVFRSLGLGVLMVDGQPVSCRAPMIEAIMAAEDMGQFDETTGAMAVATTFRIGDDVVITCGPLEGYRATVRRMQGRKSKVAEIELGQVDGGRLLRVPLDKIRIVA